MRNWIYSVLMLSAWSGLAGASVPIFENRTPIGFAPADSSSKADFVVGEEVHLRVDLNQAVTNAYPLFGHFHSLEKSDKVGTTATDGMQVDIAIVDVGPFGTNSDQAAPGETMATVPGASRAPTSSSPRSPAARRASGSG